MEFKKLVKPLVVVNGDYDLQDVIESLALFYDPVVMNICKERLLMRTTLSSVLNACIKTGNMRFLKAYSNILHNRIISYASLPMNNTARIKDMSIFDIAMTANQEVYTTFNDNYRALVHTFISNAGEKGQLMSDLIGKIYGMIYKDVIAGVIYNSLDAYVTILDDTYDDKLDEIEQIISGEMSDSFDYEWYMDRLSELYNELEGNSSLLHEHSFSNSNVGADEDVPLNYAHLNTMTKILRNGDISLQLMMQKLHECTICIDCDSDGLIVPPSKKMVADLKECIKAVRLWLIDAVAAKASWGSVMSDRNGPMVIYAISEEHPFGSRVITYIHDHLVQLYTSILETIPSIYGNISFESKLDILKVFIDAIDASVVSDVKYNIAECSSYISEPTTEYITNKWTHEIYKALQTVTDMKLKTGGLQ